MQTRIIGIDLDHIYPVSPYVFGHNIEHTRACIAGGLSAQMLRNRKFAGKSSKNEGCPMEWFAIGSSEAFFDLYNIQEPYPYDREGRVHFYTKHWNPTKRVLHNERQSLGIQNLRGAAPVGIGQYGIFLKANLNYEIRMVTWSDAEAAMTVQLTNRSGAVCYAETKIALVPGDWQVSTFTLTPDTDDSDASIRFTFNTRTRITLGAVSMLPEGHFCGMRRDVVDHLKKIGPALLRWPGGNFAGEYRWEDGLLPVDMRACLQSNTEIETQPYTHGFDNHEIDTDDFIALCREVGAEPMITINAAWNTPEENAAWVEYCNGSADSQYGRMRAAKGHAEPYNVKYWALGNEMGHGHMAGPSTPEQYEILAREQANAMLAVTPDLHLFSSGIYPRQDWVDKVANKLADKASYVSLHYYSSVFRDYGTPEAAEQTAKETLEKPKEAQWFIRELRRQLGDGVHISFDEWNCWAAWYRPSSAVDGLYAVKMLHMLLNESILSDVPVCCYFEPIGEGAIEITPEASSLTAIGQAFEMLKAHKGAQLCTLDNAEEFEAVASIKDDILTATILNTDLHQPKTVALQQFGDVIESKMLACDTLLPHSHLTEKPLNAACEEGMLMIELPPLSTAFIRMKTR